MTGSLVAALAGVLAGLLSGLFGVGGALITTPVVRLVLGRPELVAVGTPLLIVVPTALAGSLGHHGQGSADVRAGVVMGLAGAPFAVLGALGAQAVGGGPILIATAGVLGYVAVRMWLPAQPEATAQDRAVGAPVSTLLALGATAGALSGLMGLGGGFVMVPALAGWLGYPLDRAAGTSLVAISLLAVPGAATHAALGHVEWGLALALALGVVPGALLGARLAGRLHGDTLRRGFAVFLLCGAVALAANEVVVILGG